MRRSSYPEHQIPPVNWQALKLILPYLYGLFGLCRKLSTRYVQEANKANLSSNSCAIDILR